jgi:hypothetical protein
MKKVITFLIAVSFLASIAATALYAGGDQNHGSVGQGSTGSDGQGEVTQNSR